MKGADVMLLNFMDKSKANFVIPIYQRRYSWKKEQCKQLYDDLVALHNAQSVTNCKNHFFGSIVAIVDSNGISPDFTIIDEQQRITTVSLILLAIRNILMKNDIPFIKQDLSKAEELFDLYLKNKYADEQRKIKLKLTEEDQTAYLA